MIVLVIVLLIVLVLGIAAFRYACLGEGPADLRDPQVLELPRWKPYADYIRQGQSWLDGQQVQPLRVMSYDGKVLFGRFVPCEEARGTVVFMSGYRSTYEVDFSLALEYFHSLGLNLLLCDPRANGESGGKFITFGAKERYDVLSWVTYLSMMLGEEHPVILDGMSMGASTVLLASELEFPARVCGIIADSGYSSGAAIVGNLAKKQFRTPAALTAAFLNCFTLLLGGFSLYSTNVLQAVRNTDLPVLLIHGTADTVVPFPMAKEIYEAYNGPKTLLEVADAGHGGAYVKEPDRCKQALADFVDKVLAE